MSAGRKRGIDLTAALFAPDSSRAQDPFTPRITAGIDEAGLGPMLGPLVIGLCALRVERAPLDLWEALELAVARTAARGDERLVVADSKVLFARTDSGALRLENTVLAFDAWRGELAHARTCTREFLAANMSTDDEAAFAREPWSASLPARLAHAEQNRDLSAAIASLRTAGARAGVEYVASIVRAVPAWALNDSFARTGNKSVTHWEACVPLLKELWTRFGHEGIDLVVDRHGGRMRYAALLRHALPDCAVTMIREQPERSEYSITDHTGRHLRVVFAERAESFSLPVALASCNAKYVREVCMAAFNAYFGALEPDLVPTAGYVTDARRWLVDADRAILRSGLPREAIVRSR